MTRNTTWMVLGAATLALAVIIFVVTMIVPASNVGFKDSTTALAFMSAAAIGIERIIETLWVGVGSLVGTYWPLNVIHNQVQTLVDELDTSLKPFHNFTTEKVAELQQTGNFTADQLKKLNAAPADIARFQKRFDELRNLAPSNQRVQLLSAAAAQNVKYLTEQYGDIITEFSAAAPIANATIDGLQNFLATFKDNPGRRLISIYIGAMLGLIVAGLFGLDIFQATLGTSQHPLLSIIFTGMVIGLGSSPTHEVIRVIQEYKESRKGQNAKQPDLP